MKIRSHKLLCYLVTINLSMSYGSSGHECNETVTVTVNQGVLSELKQTKKDNKNGMVVFYKNDDLKNKKIASGIFPTMTHNTNSYFEELVDVIFPEKASEFKNLYIIHTKLSDLMNRRAKIKKWKKKKNEVQDEEKQKKELQAIHDLCGIIKQCLGSTSCVVKLDNSIRQKFIDVYDNNTRNIPSNKISGELKKCIEELLSPLISDYISKLKFYYDDMIQIAPQNYIAKIKESLEDLLNLNEKTPAGFKKFIEGAIHLRNFAHTEDILVYLQKNEKIFLLQPQIFSLNDLCHICREKFSSDAPARKWLPKNTVYISIFKLSNTTVDYIFDCNGNFNIEDASKHKVLPGICQVRIPDPSVCSKYNMLWKVQFNSFPNTKNFDIKTA